MRKQTKKRKSGKLDASDNYVASIDAQDDFDPCIIPPDLETELVEILAKNKDLPQDDKELIILSNIPPKAYTRQKDEVLNDFLNCLSIEPRN